ncbi:MAG: GNAT family N-acetyltransferase [Anaerolineales bacterium]|jgi:predicted acetyltransferase|nr:GNAT family N-acetyltransferase [Anaerolineales bacterium]
MNISLTPIAPQEKTILQRLMQLYLYDFSEFTGNDLDKFGKYPFALTEFWNNPQRRPYLIRVGDHIAGFVLVGLHATSLLAPPKKVNFIAEFFVMKKHRKHGVGEFAARWVFDQFPGDWEVDQIAENLPAQAFWRKIIHRYTNGQFQEVVLNNENHDGPLQYFSNRP